MKEKRKENDEKWEKCEKLALLDLSANKVVVSLSSVESFLRVTNFFLFHFYSSHFRAFFSVPFSHSLVFIKRVEKRHFRFSPALANVWHCWKGVYREGERNVQMTGFLSYYLCKAVSKIWEKKKKSRRVLQKTMTTTTTRAQSARIILVLIEAISASCCTFFSLFLWDYRSKTFACFKFYCEIICAKCSFATGHQTKLNVVFMLYYLMLEIKCGDISFGIALKEKTNVLQQAVGNLKLSVFCMKNRFFFFYCSPFSRWEFFVNFVSVFHC